MTGKSAATIGVFGTKAETGPTAPTIKAIIRLGLRTASEPISPRKRSNPPERNSPAEIANKPINVIRAGLPKPCIASPGLSTPLATSRATASKPVISGASQPVTKRKIEPSRIDRVMRLAELLIAVSSSSIRTIQLQLNIQRRIGGVKVTANPCKYRG